MTEPAMLHRGNFWTRTPLYLRIIGGLIVGVIIGSMLMQASHAGDGTLTPIAERAAWIQKSMKVLDITASMLLRLLGLIAPPLILIAVIRAIITAEIRSRLAGRLIFLLALNTLVAIAIGLFVANVVKPGKHEGSNAAAKSDAKEVDFVKLFVDQIPRDILSPFISKPMSKPEDSFTTNSIGVILMAVAVGMAGRTLAPAYKASVVHATNVGFEVTVQILHYVIQVVPLAVMAKVAYIISEKGFSPFLALGWFICSVLLALILQAAYYLLRVKFGSWVSPVNLIRGTRDALVMAFSTASSTATMPVTYESLKKNVGLREKSASLGGLVGSNFNNDGTALYEAMSALFIAQLIGQDMSLMQQIIVVLTSVVAAVGAAGIPEAGLVTMTLVFNAVGLPVGYIALLLPVDWFLDRCRTAINVMGDMNVSCLLDGKTRETPDEMAEEKRTGFDPILTSE
ncbi:MAG: dicarboxylate/amino acid:cation symporter [Burkholderiales bacterium]|nr:dicarboxylate/amino acid:cation symporter [Phycisphaerae bacterium]